MNQYDTPVSASDVNTLVSFGFTATKLSIKNDGPNSARINFAATTASATADFELKINEVLDLSVDGSEPGWTFFSTICSTGQTATLRPVVIGF